MTVFGIFRFAPLAIFICASFQARAEDRLAFRTEVLPILTKAGCNAGACHGAATGQGGFKLSLLGYDPEEDYDRITRELGGRRLDLDHPTASLFLRKATHQIDHEGGRRVTRTSKEYQRLTEWIHAGAAYGSRDLRVKEITVSPADRLAKTTNESAQLKVTALLTDGSKQDVTPLALYTSNDDAIAEVSKAGEVTVRGSGVTSVMVRYSGQVAAARVAMPFAETQFRQAKFPVRNFIDEHVAAELKRLRLPASPLSENGEFLRRVFLDVIGRLPTVQETRSLSSAKREQVIDDLLQRDEFTDFWTMRFADLLLISGKKGNEAGARAYHFWLREQIAKNIPFDQIAKKLLTANGKFAEVGPANFFTLANDPRDMAEHVSRIFLSSQIACARCHAHPADRWTQDDCHRFAAYFARVGHEGGGIQVATRGEVDHPKTGQPLSPQPLGAHVVPALAGSPPDRRIELADWLTSPENPMFPRALVNRVWKHLLGRGLVEPVDDLRPTNPATHPELLEALAKDFVAHKYDLRALIRTITTSAAYQLTSRTTGLNRLDDRFYSHAYLKELPAQVFVDAVAQVAGVPDRFEDAERAVQLIGSHSPSFALDVLGRCSRDRPCDGPARSGGGLAAALHLINGTTINEKLNSGIVQQLLQRNASNREIIEEFYLRALSRPPAPEESSAWESLLQTAPNRSDAVADLLWTLLNSREFAFNH